MAVYTGPTNIFPATSTYSELFPTPSTSSTSSGIYPGGGGAASNVYYLVFVGILLVLLILAACLAYRAYRMRRRFRTATQLAIARGEPLPANMREDYWGLGRLSGWTPQGLDRFGPAGLGGLLRENGGRWKSIPVLYEAIIEEREGKGGDVWDEIQPVTVYSLRPRNDVPQSPLDEYMTAPSRNMGPRPRPPPMISLSSFANRGRRQGEEPVSAIPPVATEANRPLDPGEEVRIAVVVKMPFEGERKSVRDDDDDDDEEGTGWENGMELGVWEGHVGETHGRR